MRSFTVTALENEDFGLTLKEGEKVLYEDSYTYPDHLYKDAMTFMLDGVLPEALGEALRAFRLRLKELEERGVT